MAKHNVNYSAMSYVPYFLESYPHLKFHSHQGGHSWGQKKADVARAAVSLKSFIS